MRAVLSIVIPVLFWGLPLMVFGFFLALYVAQVNEDAERQARVREREEAHRKLRAIGLEATDRMLWIALASRWEDSGA
jgi:hypothetical protein